MRRGQYGVCCAICAVVLPLLFGGCDYARMKEDEALRTYERAMPEMPQNTIPVEGGFKITGDMDEKALVNPLPHNQQAIDRGHQKYLSSCVHCHGVNADGYGTVGQSFAPLPTNLKSRYVQQQSDGKLYYRTAFGYRRHPPLAYTVAEDDLWAIIHYIRSLAGSKGAAS